MSHTDVSDSAYWLPFSGNRAFHDTPRIITRAEGRYLFDDRDARKFDSLSGLWCCGAGHNRREIQQAVARQLETLDYSPAFQYAHPQAFTLAKRLASMAPEGLDHVFFTNSGSDAADTAIKMARAYWRLRGRPEKIRLIGRAKGYHGVNVGGTSVGGIGPNRMAYGPLLETSHLPHTLQPELSFTRGQADTGAELADALLDHIALQGTDNIAAVIVEPMSGSAGVIVPPRGYLERLRALCTEHDILLIFDEVITGFGRVGAAFGAQAFCVTPDILTLAKQVTNGAIPMGAVIADRTIHDAFMNQSSTRHAIEFTHGYTYSAHPVACAAALAALDLYEQEDFPGQTRRLAPHFEEGLHSLKGVPGITDLRNYGLAGAIQLAPRDADPTLQPTNIAKTLWEQGFYVRHGGDTLQFAPPFSTTPEELSTLFNAVGEAIEHHGQG
ncbi:aminotransferase class III-fold pyridoxal phosphate-dependent enzyme [Larsenimonas rhizosphaerae]|uniref:aminotransferase class III-fold pyridoxal phosphate-dependent enzyme n=1 Tax=Larsenimonas rhizosphaerae TaxID=2944682 RepID=UPI00203320CE|nr:aminotransferase class III-fold pyridoxal phosphate-dependent enzyme [Larsenimonas rhizosphaerae]MCM2131115.1 aminotransferase class III-fold pyridoxal phosphate-dependent enzyme [Larsenimonas rhizosphaerae]